MEVKTKALDMALKNISRVITGRTTLPILSTVKLACKDESLIIEASNLDEAARIAMSFEGEPIASVCVNAKRLTSIIGSLQGQVVDLQVNAANDLVIDSLVDGATSKLVTLSVEEFPHYREMTHGNAVATTSRELGQALAYTIKAASDDETRAALNGVFFTPRADGLGLVSTDGRRLHIETLTTKTEGTSLPADGRIIPTRAVLALIAFLDSSEPEEQVFLDFKEDMLLAQIGNDAEVISKYVAFAYPNYQQVIPDFGERVPKLECATSVVDKGLARVISLGASDGKAFRVRLQFPEREPQMKVGAAVADHGEVSQNVQLSCPCDVQEFVANPIFLREAISGSETTVLQINSEMEPGLIFNKDNSARLAVVMPMRI